LYAFKWFELNWLTLQILEIIEKLILTK